MSIEKYEYVQVVPVLDGERRTNVEITLYLTLDNFHPEDSRLDYLVSCRVPGRG